MCTKDCLLGKSKFELTEIAKDLNLPAFVGQQMSNWLYQKAIKSIDDMTNLSKKAREVLNEKYEIGATAPIQQMNSADGTIKFLFKVRNGSYVESVYIPDGERATLCVSSQVGCKMNCAFCMTGRQGFNGQLTTADILNQIYSLPQREKLTNVVFMGQGEPMDNLEAVLPAIKVLTSDWGFSWSPKRITVSSVGIQKGLERFINECDCHLAISLHDPFSSERAELMPAEKAFPIADVVSMLMNYNVFRKNDHSDIAHQRRVSFEYIMFSGVNDSDKHARELVKLLSPLNCRVNLIRFHQIPDSPLTGTSEQQMLRFRDYLTTHGLFATIRASRGEDILAACGLLSTLHSKEEINNSQQ